MAFFPRIVEVGRRLGSRFLFAGLNRENSEFTWIVTHPDDFASVEAVYVASADPAEVFADEPMHANAMQVAMVDTVDR